MDGKTTCPHTLILWGKIDSKRQDDFDEKTNFFMKSSFWSTREEIFGIEMEVSSGAAIEGDSL